MHPRLAKKLARCLVEGTGLLQVENNGGYIVTDTFAFLTGIHPAQKQNRLVYAGLAELDSLGQKGNAKRIYPQVFQFAADIHETMAISIGLDHSQYFRALWNGRAYDPVIMSQSCKIDFGEGGTAIVQRFDTPCVWVQKRGIVSRRGITTSGHGCKV